MNVNSFLIKGWAVTLVAALFAFAAKDTDIKYVLITYISTPVFWILDGYYLSIERQYRELYDVVRQKSENDIDFDLNARPYNNWSNGWLSCIVSRTLFIFYGVLVLITILVMVLIN